MIIGAIAPDSLCRARVTDAARSFAHLHCCDKVSELLALVEPGLVNMAVIDMRDADGASTLDLVRAIRRDYPSVPVVLYFALSASRSRDMLEFARAGVSEIIIRDVDDAKASLRSALVSASDQNAAALALTEIETLVPPSVIPIFRYCLEQGRRALTVEDVARGLNVHRKTLVERLRAAGLPSPSAVLAWTRLVVAARLLEDPGRSVEQVALLLDYPSGNSLRNMMKRYTGLRASEVRENGGMRCVMHQLKQQLSPAARQRAAG